MFTWLPYVPELRKRLEKVHFGDIDISASTPPTDVKLVPNSGVLRYDIEFYLGGGGYRQKYENQILPPLVLKRCSLERSH